jgi:hypothetical protein
MQTDACSRICSSCTAVLLSAIIDIPNNMNSAPQRCLRQEQLLAGWEGQPDKAFAASIIQYDLHRGGLAPGARQLLMGT